MEGYYSPLRSQVCGASCGKDGALYTTPSPRYWHSLSDLPGLWHMVLFPGANAHSYDYQLYYAAVRANAEVRVSNFFREWEIKQHAIDRANTNFKKTQAERLDAQGKHKKKIIEPFEDDPQQALLNKQFEKKLAHEDLMRRRQITKDERTRKLEEKQARLDHANSRHGQSGPQWQERNARLIDNAATIAGAHADAVAKEGATVTTTAASGDVPDGR